MFTDGSGRTLVDYPRPSVAVDTAVLTLPTVPGPSPDGLGPLSVVLVTSGPTPRLPGTFLHEGETLADAVLRSLRDKAGVRGLRPRQLHVFDDPQRDDRGWVLSVAHIDAVPGRSLQVDEELAGLVPVTDLPDLPYGHHSIVERAVAALRLDYLVAPDPYGLLPQPFSLRELQRAHEAVAGSALPRDAFRRAMEHRLRPTGETVLGSVGKPARLFTRAGA